MSLITDNFEKVAKERNLEFDHQENRYPLKNADGEEVEQVQQFYQTSLKISQTEAVPCAVIIHDAPMDIVNYQITYNHIGQVTDRNKLAGILEKLNEINSLKSGYYHFVVSASGELVMRHLGMTGEDTHPLVDTFMSGGRILNLLIPELRQISGLKIGNAIKLDQ